MTLFDFKTSTHGKCIIAGEHAVLRQHSAIVTPVLNKTLCLQYKRCDAPVTANFDGDFGDDANMFFWSVLERGLDKVSQSIGTLQGEFSLHNTIPVGCGMGASGALCAAMANWFVWQGWVTQADCFEFARELEDLFHGKSSGIDILGSMQTSACLFTPKDASITPLDCTWQPQLYLSHSGQIGRTSACIQKVNHLWEQSTEQAQRIDEQMQQAVAYVKRALSSTQEDGIHQLTEGLNKARICFSQWGLCSAAMDDLMNQLLAAGALAVKPTGSGDGGYVLSLWPAAEPSAELVAQFAMIRVNI